MPQIVGIRFKEVTKVYYFSPEGYEDIKLTEPVIVETSRGKELGWVAIEPRDVPQEEIKGKLKKIVRLANPTDLVQMEEFRSKEEDALERCRQKVAEMELPMKIVRAEYSFDGKRLLFTFTAEQRVDFRELVRYLARSFRTRIEMKQIGARDEAKLLKGVGRCGRFLCCSSWLTDFYPVSIKMAKQQDLPLSPAEISGQCGRLLCCLAYENDYYTEMKKKMPKPKSEVQTPHGKGIVREVNMLNESIKVELPDETMVEVSLSMVGKGPEDVMPEQETETEEKEDTPEERLEEKREDKKSERRPRRRSGRQQDKDKDKSKDKSKESKGEGQPTRRRRGRNRKKR